MYVNDIDNDPYINLEYRDFKKKKIYTHRTGNYPFTRRICKRSVLLCLLYTLITFGVYLMYWEYALAKETNKLSNDDTGACPGKVVFFSIITLGIYAVYWAAKTGKKQNNYFILKKNEDNGFKTFYLILMIIGYVVPGMNVVCFCFMQNALNKMIAIADEENPSGVQVRDNSILNHPFWATLLLFLFAHLGPQIFMCFYEQLFIGLPGNPANILSPIDGAVQTIAQNSADQVASCDTPFMISHCLLSIFLMLLIMWWFRTRYKNSGYPGVLVTQNLGKACLLALPGILFAGLNCLSVELEYFKWGLVLLGFVPAFVEEISFRGLIIPNLMRIYNNGKGIALSLLIPAVIFGLMHMTNIFAGANLGTTLFQVGYTFSMGIFWGALLIRTGNLWPGVIIHGVIDTLAFMTSQAAETGGIQTQEFVWSFAYIPIIVLSVIFLFYGIWLVRPKKRDEIVKLWSEKWGSAIINR